MTRDLYNKLRKLVGTQVYYQRALSDVRFQGELCEVNESSMYVQIRLSGGGIDWAFADTVALKFDAVVYDKDEDCDMNVTLWAPSERDAKAVLRQGWMDKGYRVKTIRQMP